VRRSFQTVSGRVFLRSLDTLWGRDFSISPNLYSPPQDVVPARVA
jgi:hypothetical protein